MAVTASGWYLLTLEKFLIDTLGDSLEAEDNNMLLVTDSETPNFDTNDFRNDVTAEVSGTGYSTGGKAYTSTEITNTSGVTTFDFADVSWTSSTIANAMAAICYRTTGTASTDELFFLLDFVSAVSSSSGTLTVQINASGAFTMSNP